MISILIIAVVTIALFSTISMGMLNMGNQTEQVLRSLDEHSNFMELKTAIKQKVRPIGVGRQVAIPLGAESPSGYMTLPSTVTINNKNTWGQFYVYCPYSPTDLSGVGSDTVRTSSSDSYEVNTVTYKGEKYVISSERPPFGDMGALAVIISPIPGVDIPQCEDVRFDSDLGDFYTVDYNGIVTVILEDTTIISREPVVKSLDANDSSLFVNEEVLDWSIQLPDLYTLNFIGSPLSTNDMAFVSPLKNRSKQVVLSGSGSSRSTLTASAPVDVTFENVTVSLSNMHFDENINVIFRNSNVYLDRTVIQSIVIENSEVISEGYVEIGSASTALVKNSYLDFSAHPFVLSKQNSNVGLHLVASTLKLGDASVSNETTGGVGILVGVLSNVVIDGALSYSGSSMVSALSLDSQSSLILDGATVSASQSLDTMIYSQGQLRVTNSYISGSPNINNAIVLGESSELNMTDSSLGSVSSMFINGVRDLGGAKFISGSASVIYANSSCWLGDIFYSSDSGSGDTSESTDVNYRTVNKSSWSCQK